MSTNPYQVAYESAVSELAEIGAQIQHLTRRKELLEKLLAPLEPLLPESAPPTTAVAAADLAQSEFPVSYAPAEAFPSLLNETNGRAIENGRCIPHEEIACLAFSFWNERGRVHGNHDEDWFRAVNALHDATYSPG